MIVQLLISAAVSTATPVAPPNLHELVAGASHAVRANRLDQANLMVARAVAAGASGAEIDRVIADLAYARGNYAEALARYELLLKSSAADPALLEPAAISALKLGQLERATDLLSSASWGDATRWRLWNALGVAADLRGDWANADEFYKKASRLAPKEAGPINNQGWSMLLRGDWKRAIGLFERATELNPKSTRIANNLELAKMALGAGLPARESGESESSWAARLNDAGVAAAILGDR